MSATFTTDELNNVLPALRRFAMSLTRDPESADDLVQDSVERALRKAHYYEPGTNFRSWMFTLCRRLFLNDIRKQKTRGISVDLDDSPQAALSSPASQEKIHECREVMERFDTLPTRDREIISLIAVDGMKYAEAARHLKTPVGTIRSRLSRARTRLKDLTEQRREILMSAAAA